jgi:hypothetical protein
MSNLSFLRNALKLNADLIAMIEFAKKEAKLQAADWKSAGETAFFIEACDEAEMYKKKLANAVAHQRRTKVEIQAIFRKDRIRAKYLKVFGKLPEQQIYTTVEQEAMLDTLLAEKQAAAAMEASVSQASVA